MIEIIILIPTVANDGTVFSVSHHMVFETRLAETFGGFSLLPLTVAGAWIDGGVTYRDELRQYVVFVASITDGGKVGGFVAWVKIHYMQLAITIRYLGLSEIL